MTLYSCSDISYNKNYVVLVHNISCDYIQIEKYAMSFLNKLEIK